MAVVCLVGVDLGMAMCYKHIWAPFVRQFVANNLKKSPNLATLNVTYV